MSCDATVTNTRLTPWPNKGIPGGRAYGSVTIKGKCVNEEAATAELAVDEDVSWFWSWASDKTVYSRAPQVVNAARDKEGFVTIEDAQQVDAQTVEFQVNVTTKASGQQTFDLKVKCRCHKGASWTPLSVDVSFNI